MPSENQQGADESPWPAFPEIEDQIGENPAKFLVGQDLPPAARIRGLSTKEQVNAYLRVEAKTRQRHEVIARLNRRKQELEERERAREVGPTEFSPASEIGDEQTATADGGGPKSELVDELDNFPETDDGGDGA